MGEPSNVEAERGGLEVQRETRTVIAFDLVEYRCSGIWPRPSPLQGAVADFPAVSGLAGGGDHPGADDISPSVPVVDSGGTLCR